MELKKESLRRLGGLLKRLDHLNCSLAGRALPENRRRNVSELALQSKALKAGQKPVEEKRTDH